MAIERTLAAIKPHALLHVNTVIDILQRYVTSGLAIAGLRKIILTPPLFYRFYGHLKEKPFFPLLEDEYRDLWFLVLCLEGENAVQVVRDLNGATDPCKAAPGTIRYDYGLRTPRTDGFTDPANAVHGSDSVESAERELRIFFSEKELAR